jgi:hypothetical protein
MDRQLELTLGPQYVVEVEDRLSTALSRRNGGEYGEALPEGEGPWRRPLAGGLRVVRLVRVDR